MTNQIIIIALIVALIYLYYQNRKLKQQSHFGNSGGTLFSFQEEQLEDQKTELQTHLDQALALQAANQTKLGEQAQEISNLKNRLQVYEGVGASGSGENEKLKEVLNERDELKRTNQNLTLDKEKLTEDLKELADLEIERDEAIREKSSLEQDLTATANRLKLKAQEVQNQHQEISRIKKEAQAKDKSLNEKIKDWKSKYQEKVKQFDNEQLEHNKLIEKMEQLEQQVEELKRSKSPMPGEFPEDDKTELEQKHQDQLRKINLLFDDNATNYQQIDFNGLYSLLENLAEEQKKKKKKTK